MSVETRTCDKSPNKAHCWHPARFTHTMPNHTDETCCWCGVNRCVNMAPLYWSPDDPDHGAHRP